MHRLTLLLALLTLTTALPLNINLGAYSPALVVGDGAISFEGAEGAEGAGGTNAAQLVNALQGAAVGTAGAAAGAGRVNGAATGITVNAAAAPAGDGPGTVQAAAAPKPILNDPVCCYSLYFVCGLFCGAGVLGSDVFC